MDDIWLTKGCPKNIKIVQQALDCKGELKLARYGSPSTRGYDGVHLRGSLSVQHYTGSVINVMSDIMPKHGLRPINISSVPGYVKFEEQNQGVSKNRVKQQSSNFMPAQPKLVKTFPQMPNSYANVTNTEYNQQFYWTPPTSANTTPFGGGHKLFNLKTQNRFSPVSGN